MYSKFRDEMFTKFRTCQHTLHIKQIVSVLYPKDLRFIIESSVVVFVGIVSGHYNPTFKSHLQLCLSILKRFGFGSRVMETRILMGVEEMINKVREKQGRPFDLKQVTTSCVANIMLSMVLGHRFDHSDPAFQQFISDMHDAGDGLCYTVEIFPLLRFLPHFKKLMAKAYRAMNRVSSFIDSNISTSLQVCNDNALAVIFSALII